MQRWCGAVVVRAWTRPDAEEEGHRGRRRGWGGSVRREGEREGRRGVREGRGKAGRRNVGPGVLG